MEPDSHSTPCTLQVERCTIPRTSAVHRRTLAASSSGSPAGLLRVSRCRPCQIPDAVIFPLNRLL
jgi:hypothetical protein